MSTEPKRPAAPEPKQPSPEDGEPRSVPSLNLRACFAALCASFSVLGFEIVYFQELMFLTDYTTATMIISIALLGITAGSMLSFLLLRWGPTLRPLALLLTGPAAAGGFFVASQVPGDATVLVAVMTIPFLFGAFVISMAFAEEPRSGFVYAADLLGAGLGALGAAILMPLVREEGSVLAIGVIVSASSLFTVAPGAGKPFRVAFFALAAVVVLGIGAMLTWQVTEDRFNLMYFSEKQTEAPLRHKLYSVQERVTQLSSHGSLVERIDIFKFKGDRSYNVGYNGLPNDHVSRGTALNYQMDRRLPVHLFDERLEAPKILVLGASAEGINKPAALVAGEDGFIVGLEYNATIPRAVLEDRPQVHADGRYWYEGMDLRTVDGRTYLARHDEKFDMITMLNTHKVRSIGVEGPPEYLHTITAVEEYLNHLTPKGAIVIEERNFNPDCNAGIHNYLATIAQALRNRGDNPENHILFYEYYARTATSYAIARSGIGKDDDYYSSKRYAIILVFNSPVNEDKKLEGAFEEWRTAVDFMRHAMRNCYGKDHCLSIIRENCRYHFTKYYDSMGELRCQMAAAEKAGCKCEPAMGHFSIRVRHSPWETHDNTYTAAISKPDTSTLLKGEGYVVRVSTEDRPFVQDVDAKQPEVDKLLKITASAAVAFVGPLILGVLLFVLFRNKKTTSSDSASARAARVVTVSLIAAIVGLAYLLVEVVLIQRFAMFTGSPASSLLLILPSMLIFSGVGGLLAERYGSRFVIASLTAIVVMVSLFNAVMLPALDLLVQLPWAARYIAAILLLAPLFIAMGSPLAFALKQARIHLNPAIPVLLFGANGAFGAVATPVGIKLSMNYGFAATMRIGAAAYAAVILLVLLIVLIDKLGKSAPKPA